MFDDIVNANALAKKDLQKLKETDHSSITPELTEDLLRKAILHKLMIESEEDKLRDLVVISIKSADLKNKGVSEDMIRKQITKYDCHQTSLVVQKKALLLIFIEKELGIKLSDEEAVDIQTIKELAACVYEKLKEADDVQG